MLNKIRQLAGDSVIYGLSGLITRFITIFLIPIYTRIFAPADYGIINLISATFLLIGIFVVLGLDNSAAIWYWDKEDDKERNITFSSWFWTQFSISCLFSLCICFFSSFLSKNILKSSVDYSYLFILAAINLPLTTFTLVLNTWLRVKRKPMGAVSFSLLSSLLTIGLSIYFVVYLRIGLKGVFLSQLISSAVSSIVVVGILYRTINPSYFMRNRIIQMLKYSGPLIPATISFWLLNSAGAYFINHYATQTDVGLYQIGSSIAAVCNIIFWAFLQAWSPFAMSIHKQDDARRVYSVVFDLYCGIGGSLVLFIFLYSPEILMVLTTKAYYGAALVAGLLSINIFISNITQITSIGCSIMKTNVPYAVGVFIGSVCTVLLYMILIPLFGKEGAALSTLTGSLILSAYVTYKAQLVYFIPYHLRKNIVLIILLILLVILSYFIKSSLPGVSLIFKSFLLLLFLIFVFYFNKTNVNKLWKRVRIMG